MTVHASRAAWCVALIVLLCALVFFNMPASSTREAAETPADPLAEFASDAPSGHEVGEQLPDFTLTTVGGKDFTLSAHRGGVTIINLWATWCTPCVNELPHFDKLQRTYPEDVTVLAIHSDLITDDVAEYLAGYDYAITFAIDEGGEIIKSVGGSTMLPQTMVLDQYGVVTYNKVGSVTYEALGALLQEALH